MSYTFHALNVRFSKEEIAFNNQIQVQQVGVSFQDDQGTWGKDAPQYFVESPNKVAILPFDPYANVVVFIENFRIGTLKQLEGPWHLEIPTRLEGDPKEHIATVQQALKEDVQCEGLDTEFISDFYTSPALSDERIFLFCAGIDSSLIQKHAKIEVLSVAEAMDAIYGNYFQDASTIMSLHWLHANQQRLQEKWQ